MNLQEHIRKVLREETSVKERTRNMVSKYGFSLVKDMFGDDKKFYDTIDLHGSLDDMLFIVKSVMEHEVKARLCSFNVEKTQHSIKVYFEVPKYFPDKDKDYWPNKRHVTDLENFISDRIFNLGRGKVRGLRMIGSIGDC